MFILICNRKDLSLLLSSLNTSEGAILKVLIITEVATFFISNTVSSFSLFLKENNLNLFLNIEVIVIC